MAYLDYKYNVMDDTLSSIADGVGITVSELAKINNLQYPIHDDLAMNPTLHGTIKIPELYSGNESFENIDRTDDIDVSVNELTRSRGDRTTGSRNVLYSRVGIGSEGTCWIQVGNKVYYFPGYPESFSDTRNATYTPQNPLGRSEPFQIYENSGPREVSVTFRMHREMFGDNIYDDGENRVDQIVAGVQSATYPMAYGEHLPPKVRLVIGNACDITGIINGQVSANWSETIIDHRYQIVELSFSVIEVTGNPITLGGSPMSAIRGYNQTIRNSGLV